MTGVTCTHWSDGACALGLFRGRPSPSKCSRCEQYEATPGATERLVQVEVKAKPLPHPVPRKDWPLLARVIARLSTPEDTGVGDTIHRQLGRGGEWFQTAFHTLTGKDCGCSDRQAFLNAKYPYESAEKFRR